MVSPPKTKSKMTLKQRLALEVHDLREKKREIESTLKSEDGPEMKLRDMLKTGEQVFFEDILGQRHGYEYQTQMYKEYDMKEIEAKGLHEEFKKRKRMLAKAQAGMAQFDDMMKSVPKKNKDGDVTYKLAPVTKEKKKR